MLNVDDSLPDDLWLLEGGFQRRLKLIDLNADGGEKRSNVTYLENVVVFAQGDSRLRVNLDAEKNTSVAVHSSPNDKLKNTISVLN